MATLLRTERTVTENETDTKKELKNPEFLILYKEVENKSLMRICPIRKEMNGQDNKHFTMTTPKGQVTLTTFS